MTHPSLLPKIAAPSDLRRMTMPELERLAAEIREEITQVVHTNGGHFASNLGTVELAIALHYCTDFREGHLLWDVGHQAYAHKLLTGRQDQFHTLRQEGGMSGFPNFKESPFDTFTTGHAGTSISTGLGLVCGYEQLKNPKPVVVVIGDGSITPGMAIEAINHAGALDKNMLIILNDNSMSIAETVGGLSKYLTRIRTAPFVEDLRKEVYQILEKVPLVGHKVHDALEHIQAAIRKSMVPGILFEELGLTYLGPVDGHDIPKLIKLFSGLKTRTGPVLVHAITEKGRGNEDAVGNPVQYHAPKLKKNGKVKKQDSPQPTTYTTAFVDALMARASEDKRIVAITAAMPDGTGITRFRDAYPDRYYDVGIAEQHAVALAAGMRRAGCRPVAAIYSTFLQRAYDQICHDVVIQELGVTFAIDRAGLVGADGVTHQGVYDIAYLRPFPGIVMMAPADTRDMEQMLGLSLDLEAPSSLRYPRGTCPDTSDLYDYADVTLGTALTVRHGSDGAILALGSMVVQAVQAADRLKEEGIDLTVVNARFIKPLDQETILSLIATHPFVLTVEEHLRAGGFGSAVLEMAAAELADCRKLRILALPDQCFEHAERDTLLHRFGLSVDGIADEARRLARASTRTG